MLRPNRTELTIKSDSRRQSAEYSKWFMVAAIMSFEQKIAKMYCWGHMSHWIHKKKQKFKVPQSRSGEITLVLHKILAKTKSLKFVSVGHICLIFCCDNPCHDLKKRVLRVVSVKSWRWNLLRNLMHAFCVEQITCKRPSFLQVNLFVAIWSGTKCQNLKSCLSFDYNVVLVLVAFFVSRTKKKKVNENRTFLRNRKFVFVPKKSIRLGARRKTNFIWREVPQGKIKSVVHWVVH